MNTTVCIADSQTDEKRLGTCQNVLFDPIVSGNVDFSGGTAAWKLCGIQCRAYFRCAQQNLRTVAGTPEFGISSRCNQVDLVAGGDESGQTVAGRPDGESSGRFSCPA